MPPATIRRRKLYEEIADDLERLIQDGQYAPEDLLPSERDLMRQYGVGRPAVREALRTLEISGVVSLQKGVKGGAFIRDGNPALLTQSLQDLMFLGRVSLAGLAEARRLINGMVIELACERATEEDFAAIEQNIAEIEKSEDLQQRADEGVRFFGLIARATRNEVLAMLVDSLSDIIRYVIDQTGRKARPELVPVRRRILKALRARDAKAAAKGMDEYLTIVQEGMDAAPAAVPAPARKTSR